MGGSEALEWLGVLDASFDAAVAREEEVAAADLAFSLRQDVDLRGALARSRRGWSLAGQGGYRTVSEVGRDYLRAGALVVPIALAVVRSDPAPVPEYRDRTMLELLGAACRTGVDVTIRHSSGEAGGRLVRVANDHVAVQKGDAETIVGVAAIEAIGLLEGPGYSASRGFSG